MRLTVHAIRRVLKAAKKMVRALRREPTENWLTPKVYTGKSMHQEELERLGKK